MRFYLAAHFQVSQISVPYVVLSSEMNINKSHLTRLQETRTTRLHLIDLGLSAHSTQPEFSL